ncbi:MAG: PfkB family carbohydrate kinase [Alistipes putredinis]
MFLPTRTKAKAFTGEGEPLNALQMLSELCELAVVKVGIKGALIKRGSEVVHVGIMAAAKRVDTTGAGDLYAAGFLSGLCEGLTLRQCGTIGAIVAGKVIEVVGTTFSEEAWQHAFQLVEKVRSEKYPVLKGTSVVKEKGDFYSHPFSNIPRVICLRIRSR